MIWSNEHWKFVVTPRWIRTDKTTELVECFLCNGRGWIDHTEDWNPLRCPRCKDGKIEQPTRIPNPPEMDQKFLAALKEFVENYK